MEKCSPLFAFRRPVVRSALGRKNSPLPEASFTLAIFFAFWMLAGIGAAADRYTAKHIDAFAARVGKIFWIRSTDGRLPLFRTGPKAGAATFRAEDKQSFEILELTRSANDDPHYKVRFASGKEGFITPETFHEELNLTILTADPYVEERRKAEELAAEEKVRIDWIQSQPWSPAVKEASIKKQAVVGLTTGEIKQVLGAPNRVVKIRGPLKLSEERWYYTDGQVLTFLNGLLSAVDHQEKK